MKEMLIKSNAKNQDPNRKYKKHKPFLRQIEGHCDSRGAVRTQKGYPRVL